MRCSDDELSQQTFKCIRSIHPKLYTLYTYTDYIHNILLGDANWGGGMGG